MEMKVLNIIELILIWVITFAVMRQIIIRFPWLFAVMGMGVMSYMDYLVIADLIKSYTLQTFMNGVELFLFFPFCTFGVLAYMGLFYLSVTGKLKK